MKNNYQMIKSMKNRSSRKRNNLAMFGDQIFKGKNSDEIRITHLIGMSESDFRKTHPIK